MLCVNALTTRRKDVRERQICTSAPHRHCTAGGQVTPHLTCSESIFQNEIIDNQLQKQIKDRQQVRDAS